MCCKDHGTSSVCDAIGWVGGHIVEELVGCFSCGLCGLGLLRADSTEGHQEFIIHSSRVVEQGADNALYAFDSRSIQKRAGIVVGHQLHFCTVDDFAMLVW